MTPDVHLIRHGATEWSRSGRHTGRTDLELLPDGVAEAERLRDHVAAIAPTLVLVSPLRRALTTCHHAGITAPEIDADLVEWDYGDLEGRTTPEIRESAPGWTVWSGAIPGGEAITDVAARARRIIERCRAETGPVLLVSHGHFLRVLAACWCDLPADEGRRFPLDTGTISTLGWEHEYPAVRRWNLT